MQILVQSSQSLYRFWCKAVRADADFGGKQSVVERGKKWRGVNKCEENMELDFSEAMVRKTLL